MESKPDRPCPFCRMDSRKILAEQGCMFAVTDTSPVTLHHVLIIPRRHCTDYFDLTERELCDARLLVEELKRGIMEKDPRVEGFNIGVNCGEAAGQTVFHAHIHLIPRRRSDTPEPRGGVRGVIPDRMGY